jgi:hypothetical protein
MQDIRAALSSSFPVITIIRIPRQKVRAYD